MSSTYSVINDLYGVQPARREARHQGVLGLVIVILLGGMFLYESVHPVMRLRSEPPPALLKSKANLKATGARGQGQLARSYWSTAAEYVAENYRFGSALPSRPPEDFTIAMGGDYGTSSFYWHKLRGAWNQPDMWVRSYQLNTDWINSALASFGNIVQGYLNG